MRAKIAFFTFLLLTGCVHAPLKVATPAVSAVDEQQFVDTANHSLDSCRDGSLNADLESDQIAQIQTDINALAGMTDPELILQQCEKIRDELSALNSYDSDLQGVHFL